MESAGAEVSCLATATPATPSNKLEREDIPQVEEPEPADFLTDPAEEPALAGAPEVDASEED